MKRTAVTEALNLREKTDENLMIPGSPIGRGNLDKRNLKKNTSKDFTSVIDANKTLFSYETCQELVNSARSLKLMSEPKI